ncbi:MAG: hypothetical protein JNM02_08380 [Anaerolineales bacterium]|nr:hypothetical protein [Anaerolineales bacterium]
MPNVNVYRGTPMPAEALQNGAQSNGASGSVSGMSVDQAFALLQGTPPDAGLIPVTGVEINPVLGMLVGETKYWSDVQTIKLDDLSQAQIVVTFISPQLIHAMFNSEISRIGYAVSNPQPALDAIAARDELIFFMTVITSTNNNINTTSHKIQIPIQQMVIMNADDVVAPPLHDDHVLAQPINSSYEPVFGYLTYPIAMIHGAGCSWILNPTYNKRIIITIPDIFVDDKSTGSYTWAISYSSLFKVGTPAPSQASMAVDTNLVSNSLLPPSPMVGLLTPNGLPEDTFWQMYSGFLWRQVMQGIY